MWKLIVFFLVVGFLSKEEVDCLICQSGYYYQNNGPIYVANDTSGNPPRFLYDSSNKIVEVYCPDNMLSSCYRYEITGNLSSYSGITGKIYNKVQ